MSKSGKKVSSWVINFLSCMPIYIYTVEMLQIFHEHTTSGLSGQLTEHPAPAKILQFRLLENYKTTLIFQIIIYTKKVPIAYLLQLDFNKLK